MKRRPRVATHSSLYLKAGLMLIAFGLVITLIQALNAPDGSETLALVLGKQSPHQDQVWNWCPQGPFELRHLPFQRVIMDDYTLARLCSVEIAPSTEQELKTAQFVPLLRAQSQLAQLEVEASLRDEDLFRISGLAFRSKKFRENLNELFPNLQK